MGENYGESDGTKRLFDLVPLFYRTKTASFVIIDEIDRSLHTNLTKKFLELFYKYNENRFNQLVATTHDSNLPFSSLCNSIIFSPALILIG